MKYRRLKSCYKSKKRAKCVSAFDSHIQKLDCDFAYICLKLCILPKKRKEKHDQSVRFTVRIDRVWSE